MITMHIDVGKLTTVMQEKVTAFCSSYPVGEDVLIYCGTRTVKEQNTLFRASSTRKQVNKKIAHFESLGYYDLAKALRDLGPVPTRKRLTYAAGGESSHNYGCAVDGVPERYGKCLWKKKNKEWSIYEQAAKDAGLEWAGNWHRFVEYPHLQTPLKDKLKHHQDLLVWE